MSRILVLFVATSVFAFAQISSYQPPMLTGFDSFSTNSGSAGTVLATRFVVTPGSSHEHIGVVTHYVGPARAPSRFDGDGNYLIEISSSSIIGSYHLEEIALVTSAGETVYLRDGTIQYRRFQKDGLPSRHNFDLSLLDFKVVPATLPVIAAEPEDVSADVGSSARFLIRVESTGSTTIQWRKDGVTLPGKTGTELLIERVAVSDAGQYDAVVTNGFGTVATAKAILTVETGQFRNLSIRTVVPDGGILIAGFVLDKGKKVLVRALGESLAPLGVSGTMPNPKLEIFDAQRELVASNDDADIMGLFSLMARVGAFMMTSGKDAAIAIDLPAGIYTVHISPADGVGGDCIIEVYDAD